MSDKETTTSGYVDTDQSKPIDEGMQGATGEIDAGGLAPEAKQQEKLEELQGNMQSVKDEAGQ